MTQHVGSYEVVRVLARGGMAVVYLARQPTLDREVALKRLQLQSTDPTLARRFVREARLAAGLHHPNIVTLFDFFEDGGVPYIAMEYVGGGSLRRLVGHLGLPQVFAVLEGILAGLAHAEARGIAHRDLKPENVLLSRDGGIKIADFGIARAYNALTPSLTQTDSAIGTPSYMAPEQVTGDALGPYTDIYALGVITYELLSGHPPFNTGTPPVAVLYRQVHTPPPPLAELAPDVPAPVCEWAEWLLAKAPSDRPASAADAWRALEELAVGELGPYWRRAAAIRPGSGPVPTLAVADDEPSAPRSTPTTKVVGGRRRHGLAAGAAVLAVAAAGGATALLVDDDSKPHAQAAKAAPAAAAVPYDFSGDGRPELVLGFPGSGRDHAGAVVLRHGRERDVITPADAGVQPPYTGDEEFGRYVVSGDFNRDGHADLAVSTPGRDIVAVISGTAAGLAGGKVRRITPSGFRLDPGEGRFGSRMLAADMNRDRFDDLVVGAPDSDRGQGGSGIIQILFGGPRGLGTRVDSVVRPTPSLDAFGTALRTGDLNRDGKADLVEGAPDEDTRTGHLSYCLGARRGPGKCNTLTGPVSSGTSGLAVADVDGDRYDDIVQGDAIIEPAAADRGILGGEVRVWLGSRHGPVDHPQIITQATPRIPSDDEAGDRFGTSIGAADLDHDGYEDMVVSAPGEDGGDGAVTVIRGGAEGHASAAHTIFSPGNGLPVHPGAGEEVGWALVVMDISGNRRPDVITLSHHAQRLEDAVLVIEGGKGAYAAGETHVWRALRGSVGVADPAIARIRIGRGAEG